MTRLTRCPDGRAREVVLAALRELVSPAVVRTIRAAANVRLIDEACDGGQVRDVLEQLVAEGLAEHVRIAPDEDLARLLAPGTTLAAYRSRNA